MIQFNISKNNFTLTIVLDCFLIAEECWIFSCVLLYRREFILPSAWGLFFTLFGVKGFYIFYKYNLLY